jgi:ZIP family zinc transporter
MDGLGIGLAFQFSSMAGLIVAAAVLAHDLCDGANTVILSLGAGSSPRTAKQWLVADALAPLAGIVVAQLIAVPSPILALLMALFAGFFLYVGASELLPKSHQDRPRIDHRRDADGPGLHLCGGSDDVGWGVEPVRS